MLSVSSLDKVFYPKTGHTKGDLLVYYARMADHILPWMDDRPLVLRRFPDGVDGESFYQQSPPDNPPKGVRVETIHPGGESQRRLVGGNLATLLYTIQLGAISWDPWHSRVGAMKSADYSILDLDPGPGASFQRLVRVARWVREELDDLGLHGVAKTSGSTGIHIYLPLPPRTPLDAATLVARIVATRVAERHPEEATIARMTRKRPRGTVYVDFLQNLLSKSVAGVYAARARPTPTVSTPLHWEELTAKLDPHDFTIDTVPDRVRDVGDLWADGMARRNSLTDLPRGDG
jgi:bifunctional non-homologous end joining protein LigD